MFHCFVLFTSSHRPRRRPQETWLFPEIFRPSTSATTRLGIMLQIISSGMNWLTPLCSSRSTPLRSRTTDIQHQRIYDLLVFITYARSSLLTYILVIFNSTAIRSSQNILRILHFFIINSRHTLDISLLGKCTVTCALLSRGNQLSQVHLEHDVGGDIHRSSQERRHQTSDDRRVVKNSNFQSLYLQNRQRLGQTHCTVFTGSKTDYLAWLWMYHFTVKSVFEQVCLTTVCCGFITQWASCSNNGPVALCTLGLGLLNPPPLNGR